MTTLQSIIIWAGGILLAFLFSAVLYLSFDNYRKDQEIISMNTTNKSLTQKIEVNKMNCESEKMSISNSLNYNRAVELLNADIPVPFPLSFSEEGEEVTAPTPTGTQPTKKRARVI